MGKILIIDDDKGVLDAMRAILEFEGHDVSTLAKFENLNFLKEKFSLILVDYLLSGKDGKILIKKIKKSPQAKKVAVIMLSAHPDAKEASVQAGADDFISKPFEMDELIEKVNKFLKSV